ncbi:gamma-glutamylcyclotransferase [Streptomyces sp. NBC_01433]|uniref:gamma-glutamylcyclotransferase family protein n=1 Tax=unclassified Streptomyces TaxID=2593676 RepID=UPI002256E85A|nr:gamma-glutamylcyclotransferase family protein [Streptomyces sp. NBC_01433]MCX4682298.1 gamma-glutamylcyclotransferase [Streptomyces sp. NBC_01433]
MFTTDQKPVFVYGTLRAGQGNYFGILKGTTVQERPAILNGYTLFGRGVPFAVQREDRIVVGEVMDVDTELWPGVLRNLDRLEGYHGEGCTNMYDREVRTVTLDDGSTVEAYVYLAGKSSRRWFIDSEEIPGGDFVKAESQYGYSW